MQYKHITKRFITLALTSSMIVSSLALTGCSKKVSFTGEKPSFNGFQEVSQEEYLNFSNAGEVVYLVNVNDILSALPDEKNYDLGLYVNEYGNAVIVPEDKMDDYNLNCILRNCQKDNKGRIFVDTIDSNNVAFDSSCSIDRVPGYRFVDLDGNNYDVLKITIVKANKTINDSGEFNVVLTANNNGGEDGFSYVKKELKQSK